MNFFCKGGFAMRGRSSQNIWILVLLMLAGVVLGGFIAKLVGGVSALSWLAYGNSFGLSSAGFRRADIAIWADHPLYHCGYHRHYSGVFHLQKAIMIFRGQTILPFPFFQEKPFFFYEKYGSFLEKNTKKRYDKM